MRKNALQGSCIPAWHGVCLSKPRTSQLHESARDRFLTEDWWQASEFRMPLFTAHPVARSRPRSLAVAALCGLAILPGLASAQSPSITVSGGSNESVPGTYASGTYSTITVSGTGAAGERSTLTIDEAIEIDGYPTLSVFDGGLVNVNANVSSPASAYTTGSVGAGGTLNLMSGTLALFSLEVSGSGAFQRTGGSYSVGALYVSDGATVSWAAGDSIADGYAGFVGVSSGGTLELQANFVGPEGTELYLRGAGSQIVRSTGTETIAGQLGVVDGATFTLISDDAVNGLSAGELYYSADPVAPSQITLAPGTTALNLSFLGLGQGGSIVGLESVPYTTTAVLVVGQRLEYRPTDSISEYAGIRSSGTLSLQKNLALSGPSATLQLSGSTSALERNGFSVSTPDLSVYEGASLTVGDGITVSRSISVNSGFGFGGGEPTFVTLAESIVLAASDGQSPGISVSGSNAGIVRAPGLTITATGASVNTYNSGSFTMQAGDDFTGASVGASGGGRLTNSGSQTLAAVFVYGRDFETDAPSVYTAAAPLVISGTDPGLPSLQVQGGRFEADANVSVDRADFYAGELALLSGTLTVSEILAISGTAGVTVDRIAGAAYDVATLTLADGAAIDFDTSSDRVGSLSLSSSAIFTTGSTGGLVLDSLDILAAGVGSPATQLRLGSLGGTGGPEEWGLRTPDTLFALVQGWVADDSIVAVSGAALEVVQQDGFAYVKAVPEPSAVVLALGGVGIAAGLLRRRSRAARRGQPADTTTGPEDRCSGSGARS
jgi:hypothetical protein